MSRDIFRAIADPTRQAIIVLIAREAMTPKAIARNFNTNRHSVCRHLRILSECQLVKQVHQDKGIFYSLEVEKIKDIHKWLKQFRQIWETRFKHLDKIHQQLKN
jgi:DNA-binding transcriptional ArsR family regulator